MEKTIEKFKRFGIKDKTIVKKKTNNTIIYLRVSSKGQEGNFSLDTQLEKCQEYAKELNLNVVSIFGNTYESGKSDTRRKEFTNMIDYIKKHHKNLDSVIVFKTDRYSRSGSTKKLEEIEDYGLLVLSALSKYDPSTPQGRFNQRSELMSAKLDNDLKSASTKVDMLKAIKKGRWIAKAPRGYDQKTSTKEQIITINEEGKLLAKAFDWKAYENLTNEAVIARLRKLGMVISKQKLSEVFRNPFYCGIMRHKLLDGDVIKGSHPKIVSEELFLKINNVFLENNNAGYEVKNDKEEVPLIGTLKCPHCGYNLTAATSTKLLKKYGRKLFYYVCSRKGCKHNLSAKNVHQQFSLSLEAFQLSDSLTNLLRKQLVKTHQIMFKETTDRAAVLKKELKSIEADLEQAEENWALARDRRQQEICEKVSQKLSAKRAEITFEITDLTDSILNLDNYIDISLKMRNNLLRIWELANLNEKRSLQNFVFPMGIQYDKKNDHIEPLSINQFIAQKPLNKGDYADKKKQTTDQIDRLSAYVPEAGLEPAQP